MSVPLLLGDHGTTDSDCRRNSPEVVPSQNVGGCVRIEAPRTDTRGPMQLIRPRRHEYPNNNYAYARSDGCSAEHLWAYLCHQVPGCSGYHGNFVPNARKDRVASVSLPRVQSKYTSEICTSNRGLAAGSRNQQRPRISGYSAHSRISAQPSRRRAKSAGESVIRGLLGIFFIAGCAAA